MYTQNENNSARIFWIKCLRVLRAPAKKKFYIALAFIVYIVVTVVVLKYRSERNHNIKISSLKKKLLHYCNPPGPPLGNEQSEPMEYAQFKLKQVQVVARHGDRSSVVANFPNMMHFSCELKSRNLEHEQKLQMLKKMARVLKLIYANGRNEMETNFLMSERQMCKPGQLTANGYLQHIYLGEYMFDVYNRKLDINIASVEEGEITVFATPIKRTQQSAAAFMAGMLNKLSKKNPGDNSKKLPEMKIRVSTDELGYFREDENNEIPSCSELQRIIRNQRELSEFRNGMANFKPLVHRISKIFNASTVKLPALTQFFDILATHFCHHHQPPCGPGGCFDDVIKLDLVKAVDWLITAKYSRTSTLATHTLFAKITQRMLGQASGEGNMKFVLFATHDSTVAPMLMEMGIFPRQWPSFASRIVFELWEAGGLLGSKLRGLDSDKHFVRVLYDGRDFTRKVKFCQGKLKFDKLCPLTAFVQALEGSSNSMDEEYARLCVRTVVGE